MGDFFKHLEDRPLRAFLYISAILAVLFLQLGSSKETKENLQGPYLYVSGCFLIVTVCFFLWMVLRDALRRRLIYSSQFSSKKDDRPGRTIFLCGLFVCIMALPACYYAGAPLFAEKPTPLGGGAGSPQGPISGGSSGAKMSGQGGSGGAVPGAGNATGSGTTTVPGQPRPAPADQPAAGKSLPQAVSTALDPYKSLLGIETSDAATPKPPPAPATMAYWVNIGRKTAIVAGSDLDQSVAPGGADFSSWSDVQKGVGAHRQFDVGGMLAKKCAGGSTPATANCTNISLSGRKTAQSLVLDDDRQIWVRIN